MAIWETMQVLGAVPAGRDEALFLAAGALAVVAGIAGAWRPPAPWPQRWPAGLALAAALACLACGGALVAADPGALATTPVAMALMAGLAEAGMAGGGWLRGRRAQ